MKQFNDIFKLRRSIRNYLPTPVPVNVVEEIMSNGLWAPSAHNRQPWRFQVLYDNDNKHRLATAMGKQLKQDRLRDNDNLEIIEADVKRSYQRITQSPVVIVVFVTLEDMDIYPDAIRNQNEYIMAVQSTAMAVQNILLSAHASGLGTCWMCAPLFCQQIVQEALQVSNNWMPQAVITLGYPADSGKLRSRKALSEVANFIESSSL